MTSVRVATDDTTRIGECSIAITCKNSKEAVSLFCSLSSELRSRLLRESLSGNSVKWLEAQLVDWKCAVITEGKSVIVC